MDTKAIIEAVKEVGRYLVFAVVGVAVNVAIGYLATLTTAIPHVPADMQVAVIGIVVGFLRALDKYIHTNESIKAEGITGF